MSAQQVPPIEPAPKPDEHVEEPLGETPLPDITPEGGRTALETDAPPDPELGDEPDADPRDTIIANYERLLALQTRQPAAAPAPPSRAGAGDEELRREIAEIGFNRVPVPNADGTVGYADWTPHLEKLLAIAETRALNKFKAMAGPEFQAIKSNLAGADYRAALAKNGVADPAGAFARFEAKQYETDPTLNVLKNQGAPEIAAELVASRWAKRLQMKKIEKGNALRDTRLSGAHLADGAPRGSNAAGLALTIKRSDPDFGNKIQDFIDRGGDPKNVKTVR